MYRLIKQDGKAKRGELHTVHGVIQTPVFMNVGTAAAIKGAVSTADLQEIKTQVELSNTYHLMCVQVTMWSEKWADCINLWFGTSLY